MKGEMAPEMEKGTDERQEELDFDKPGVVIKGAECFDESLPRFHEIVTRDLTSIGEGKYVDDDGRVYERAISRDVDGPGQRFVCTKERYENRPA